MYMFSFFFFNDTATTEIYTLSLHDALPILVAFRHPDALEIVRRTELFTLAESLGGVESLIEVPQAMTHQSDRKSTRLNSSHANISYAVFCLKKKKTIKKIHTFNDDLL